MRGFEDPLLRHLCNMLITNVIRATATFLRCKLPAQGQWPQAMNGLNSHQSMQSFDYSIVKQESRGLAHVLLMLCPKKTDSRYARRRYDFGSPKLFRIKKAMISRTAEPRIRSESRRSFCGGY